MRSTSLTSDVEQRAKARSPSLLWPRLPRPKKWPISVFFELPDYQNKKRIVYFAHKVSYSPISWSGHKIVLLRFSTSDFAIRLKQFLHIFSYIPIYLPIRFSIHLPIHLSTPPSIYLSIHPSLHLSIHPSPCLPLYISISLSIHLPIHLPVFFLST